MMTVIDVNIFEERAPLGSHPVICYALGVLVVLLLVSLGWAADEGVPSPDASDTTAPPLGAPAPDPAAAPAPAPAPPVAPKPYRWSVLPNVSYDTDDKFGLGARAQFDVLEPGFTPFRSSFVVHLFATTNGYHHHRFRFDLVGLGAEHRLRLTGHVAFRAWLNDGYWGLGNGTTRASAYAGPFEDGDPLAKFYHYSLIQPFSNLTLRADVSGPWLVYASAQVRYTLVRTYQGSLLEQERPFGMEGGSAVQLGGGVLFDTREPEVSPTGGLLLELGARGVLQAQGAPFGGPFGSVRGYLSVGSRLVYASRLMGEYLYGEVPFYEMVQWGGFVPIGGFGGADTLRGDSFGRWRGPGKVVLDNELRVDVIRHELFHEDLRWQVVPLADVGFVFGAGADASAPPPENPLHASAGLGVRAIWATTLVGRADFAVGEDRVVDGAGREASARSYGFYLAFDHMF